ncbi:TPA: class I ribonucleotide reductase maintenance protein YfaE [Enterobacter asburiae]|jgi:ferredoxin
MISNSRTKKSVITLSNIGSNLHYSGVYSNLLTLLESYKIPVEFQCREGFCGACRLKLLKGDIIYVQEPLAFIQENEILPCCCLPVGDIEIEL